MLFVPQHVFVHFEEAQNAAPQRISEAGLGDFGFYTLANFYFSLLLGNQVRFQSSKSHW